MNPVEISGLMTCHIVSASQSRGLWSGVAYRLQPKFKPRHPKAFCLHAFRRHTKGEQRTPWEQWRITH